MSGRIKPANRALGCPLDEVVGRHQSHASDRPRICQEALRYLNSTARIQASLTKKEIETDPSGSRSTPADQTWPARGCSASPEGERVTDSVSPLPEDRTMMNLGAALRSIDAAAGPEPQARARTSEVRLSGRREAATDSSEALVAAQTAGAQAEGVAVPPMSSDCNSAAFAMEPLRRASQAHSCFMLPNVGHERPPQASEACLWTSPRWKG